MYMHYETKIEKSGSHNGNFNNLWIDNLPKIDEELAKEYFFINFSNGTDFQGITDREYEEKLYNLFNSFHILTKDKQLHEIDFLEKIFQLYPPHNPNRIIYLLVNRIYDIYIKDKKIYSAAVGTIERLMENVRWNYFEKLFVLKDTFLDAVDIVLKIIPKKIEAVPAHHIALIIHILTQIGTKECVEKLQSLKNTIWYSHPYVTDILEKHIKLCESNQK